MLRRISARSPGQRRLGKARLGGIAAALACLLAGCGGFGGGSHPAAAHAALKGQPQADPAAAALVAMVDAVGPSRSRPPVNLKFTIRKRPEVGQPDRIDYALVAQTPGLQSLKVGFGALRGLTVLNHGPVLAAVKPASGVPIFGSVTVRPDAAGLFTLTAAVAVETPNQTVMWPFTIPVIVEKGPVQTAATQPKP